MASFVRLITVAPGGGACANDEAETNPQLVKAGNRCTCQASRWKGTSENADLVRGRNEVKLLVRKIYGT